MKGQFLVNLVCLSSISLAQDIAPPVSQQPASIPKVCETDSVNFPQWIKDCGNWIKPACAMVDPTPSHHPKAVSLILDDLSGGDVSPGDVFRFIPSINGLIATPKKYQMVAFKICIPALSSDPTERALVTPYVVTMPCNNGAGGNTVDKTDPDTIVVLAWGGDGACDVPESHIEGYFTVNPLAQPTDDIRLFFQGLRNPNVGKMPWLEAELVLHVGQPL